MCLSVKGQQPAENRRAESLRPSQNPKCSSKAWSYTCVYWITSTKLETWKQNWLKQSLTEKIPLRHFPNLPAVFLLLPFSLALFEAENNKKRFACFIFIDITYLYLACGRKREPRDNVGTNTYVRHKYINRTLVTEIGHQCPKSDTRVYNQTLVSELGHCFTSFFSLLSMLYIAWT